MIDGELQALVAAEKNGGETGGFVAVRDPGGVDEAERIGELGLSGDGEDGESEAEEETWFQVQRSRSETGPRRSGRGDAGGGYVRVFGAAGLGAAES